MLSRIATVKSTPQSRASFGIFQLTAEITLAEAKQALRDVCREVTAAHGQEISSFVHMSRLEEYFQSLGEWPHGSIPSVGGIYAFSLDGDTPLVISSRGGIWEIKEVMDVHWTDQVSEGSFLLGCEEILPFPDI